MKNFVRWLEISRNQNSKLKLIYVLDILKKYSDEEHPLNSADIIEKLQEYGVSAERKALYNDIETLELYGCDIIKTGTPKKGWFIGDREFEIPEIYLLCDAVRTAKFISAKKTRELIAKLNNMLSVYEAKRNKSKVFFAAADKCANEEIYYNIDSISEAIEKSKQIKLSYSSRALDSSREITLKTREMTVNPYALTWQDDCYYLICNYGKYDNLLHLRLDRMNGVKITKTPSRHFSEVSEYREFFDVADYTNKLFGMYSGELQKIDFCCDVKIAEQVFDRFGENIFIKNKTDKTFNFTVEAAVSDALVSWIIGFGTRLKVLKPQVLQDMVKQRVQDVLKLYE